MGLTVRIEEREDETIVLLTGELDVYTVRDFRAQFDEIDPGSTHVIVDLTGVRFLDSAGVSAIVGLENRARAGGRALGVVCPSGQEICRVLEIAGLGGELVVADDLVGARLGLGLEPAD